MSAVQSLLPDQRRYLAVETAISVFLNVLVSAAFAWFPFHGADYVPLWGPFGIAVDLVPTTFMITLMVSIALTLITRRRVRAGQVPALNPTAISYPGFRWLPRQVVWRAVALAMTLTVVLVLGFVALFVVAGVDRLPFDRFFLFKLIYGGLLAILVTPFILAAALADPISRS